MKYAFYAIFIVAIAVLTYYLAESIRRPVNFHNTWAARKTVVHKQLEEIVELQKLYKVLHNDTAYAGSFDSMLNTFITDSFSILKIVGDPYDTLKKADTVRVRYPALDSLGSHLAKRGFIQTTELAALREKAHKVLAEKAEGAQENADVKAYNAFLQEKLKAYIAKMRVVPFSENKSMNIAAQPFKMEASTIALEGSRLAGNFAAPTFEVSTTVATYMPEYEPVEFSMYNPEFVPTKTVKVGDLTKVTTAGNW